ncbi:MAG: hypothetical protein WKF76_08685 [Nocardioidaceae bacterium]
MSRRTPISRRRAVQSAAAVAVAGLFVTGLSTPFAQAEDPRPASGTRFTAPNAVTPVIDENGPEVFSDEATGLADLDSRRTVAPLASQRTAVPAGTTVRWNRYGTPASLSKVNGYLSGPSTASAATAARSWLRSHAALFAQSAAQVNALELVSDSRLTQSKAHAVLFRQTYGGLTAAVDGMVTVGVAPGNRVAYVSSSLARASAAPAPRQIGALDAWAAAVRELRSLQAPSISAPNTLGVTTKQSSGWTRFSVPGFAQEQQVRLRALAMPNGTVRPVFEANVVNSAGGSAAAYTSFVDAVNGDVLIRQNRVDNLSTVPMASEFSKTFMGVFTTATPCGPRHPFMVDEKTKTIIYSASAANPANDIVIKLYDPSDTVVSSQDTGASPEAQVYTGPIVEGAYEVEVCAFDGADPIVTGEYAGTFTASEQQANGIAYPPKWKYFLSNPVLNFSPTHMADTRSAGCWESRIDGTAVPGCDNPRAS